MSASTPHRYTQRLLRSLLTGALLCTGSGLLGPGCSTPSVPLPPPDVYTAALRFNAPGTGQVVLTGTAHESHAGVRFFLFDQASGEGVITTAAADGSFSTSPLTAAVGDTARIYYEIPSTGEQSTSVCLGIQLDQTLTGGPCP